MRILKIAARFEDDYDLEPTEEQVEALEDYVSRTPEFQKWKAELLDPFPPDTPASVKEWFNKQPKTYKDYIYSKHPTEKTKFYLNVVNDMRQEKRFEDFAKAEKEEREKREKIKDYPPHDDTDLHINLEDFEF